MYNTKLAEYSIDHNMYMFYYRLAQIFVHVKKPPDYYVSFKNCHFSKNITQIEILQSVSTLDRYMVQIESDYTISD